MMIQIFEHSPTGQQPIQHQKTMDEITKLLSSFTDSGTPMFVFAKSKPAKSK